MKRWILVLFITFAASLAWGLEPDEILSDRGLEQRARDLSKQLRCVVCLNQDIDSSNAGVARTMRILLRERLVAGDSDEEVRAFFVERYGDFVLFQPPLKGSTYLLWFGPFVFFGIGAGIVVVVFRRHRAKTVRMSAGSLSAEEEHEINAFLQSEEEHK
ncbi:MULTISPECIES: cytochrome c-type biogenesis protein [unclassified Roseovarius]|uniref:cytochrome c-type biogenesis protein n=1 Tax=unclassified Roseovarius TaxID=2614913 RepID=UPI00273D2FF3|nr:MULTISPECIES: cytochrome c-type biogenesis protein [unclassified Roseovarius]